MTVVTSSDVRRFITNYLEQRLKQNGNRFATDIPDDCDLLLSGIIDSLGMLELIVAVTTHFKKDIDFHAIDSEYVTVLGPLCKFIAQQVTSS